MTKMRHHDVRMKSWNNDPIRVRGVEINISSFGHHCGFDHVWRLGRRSDITSTVFAIGERAVYFFPYLCQFLKTNIRMNEKIQKKKKQYYVCKQVRHITTCISTCITCYIILHIYINLCAEIFLSIWSNASTEKHD